MHISTARDMLHNTRQAAKSAYDVVVSPDHKSHLKAWRVWFGLSSAGRDDREDTKSPDKEVRK